MPEQSRSHFVFPATKKAVRSRNVQVKGILEIIWTQPLINVINEVQRNIVTSLKPHDWLTSESVISELRPSVRMTVYWHLSLGLEGVSKCLSSVVLYASAIIILRWIGIEMGLR